MLKDVEHINTVTIMKLNDTKNYKNTWIKKVKCDILLKEQVSLLVLPTKIKYILSVQKINKKRNVKIW